jgi:hypothetical protein
MSGGTVSGGTVSRGMVSGGVRADERCGLTRTIACDRCAAAVQVTKYSLQHTSVQWDLDSVRACAEFREREAAGQQRALIDTCASLRASIDRAVFLGRLMISSPIPSPVREPVSQQPVSQQPVSQQAMPSP